MSLTSLTLISATFRYKCLYPGFVLKPWIIEYCIVPITIDTIEYNWLTHSRENINSVIFLNWKMKKQLFFLFYSEDETNDTNAKLVTTYVNRFIIDEDASLTLGCLLLFYHLVFVIQYDKKETNKMLISSRLQKRIEFKA